MSDLQFVSEPHDAAIGSAPGHAPAAGAVSNSTRPEVVSRRAWFRDVLHLWVGLIGGIAAAASGGVAWAGLTYLLGNQRLPWMSVGMGVIVGYGVRIGNRSGAARFGNLGWGVLGGGLALVGSVWGNMLSCVTIGAQSQNMKPVDFLGRLVLSSDQLQDILVDTFVPVDLLFYGIAAFVGYRFSRRPAKRGAAPCESSCNA